MSVAAHAAQPYRDLKRGEARTGCPWCPDPDCYLYARARFGKAARTALMCVVNAHRAEFHPDEAEAIQ